MPDDLRRHRGGLDRPTLEALVARGLTQREIAAGVGRSQATVKWWLRRYGLRTTTRSGGGIGPDGRCRRHGEVVVFESGGVLRCPQCRNEQVSQRRRRVKALLVEEAGGRCALCGYDRCVQALHFHHLDPAQKTFAVSAKGLTVGIDRLRIEAAKCVLLCANCHAEVEAGVTRLGFLSTEDPHEHSES